MAQLRSRAKTVAFDGSGDKSLTLRTITRGRRSFIREGQRRAAWPCWVVITPEGYGKATGVPVAPDAVQFPYELQGLLTARAATTMSDDPELIVATIPMKIAAAFAGTEVNKVLRGRVKGIRVPVEIRIRSGRFVKWSLRGVDVLAVVEAEFISMNTGLRKALPFVRTRVKLRDLGSPVRVPLPPKDMRTKPNVFDPTACESYETQVV